MAKKTPFFPIQTSNNDFHPALWLALHRPCLITCLHSPFCVFPYKTKQLLQLPDALCKAKPLSECSPACGVSVKTSTLRVKPSSELHVHCHCLFQEISRQAGISEQHLLAPVRPRKLPWVNSYLPNAFPGLLSLPMYRFHHGEQSHQHYLWLHFLFCRWACLNNSVIHVNNLKWLGFSLFSFLLHGTNTFGVSQKYSAAFSFDAISEFVLLFS